MFDFAESPSVLRCGLARSRPAGMLARIWRVGVALAVGVWSLSPAVADPPPTLTLGVVPQQAAGALARTWGPLLAEVGRRAGVTLDFRTAPDIPAFEARLAAGDYDLAYMNPYHYTVYSSAPGYRAFARQRGEGLRGILVVRKDAPIREIAQLQGLSVAFPAPAAFAASVLPQAALRQAGVRVEPVYVRSHESVYLAVARGLYPAGGGIERTLAATAPEVREQLRVLWRTEPYTPHALAAHPRADRALVARVRDALVALADDPHGRALLAAIQFTGWVAAADADWNDVRALHIDLLPIPQQLPEEPRP